MESTYRYVFKYPSYLITLFRIIKPFPESRSTVLVDPDGHEVLMTVDSVGLFFGVSKWTIRNSVKKGKSKNSINYFKFLNIFFVDEKTLVAKVEHFPREIDGNGKRATWVHLSGLNSLIGSYCYKKGTDHTQVIKALE